jgi:tripartite-type tricarboxylate transporter receptor subunit TctC
MANPSMILMALCFGLQLGVSQVVFAQGSYPSRSITIINPFPPGGTSDIVTRPLAAALEPIVKQPVVVETKADAAGAVGAQFVATAAPDGYTLLSHITSLSGFAEVDKLLGRKPEFTRAECRGGGRLDLGTKSIGG